MAYIQFVSVPFKGKTKRFEIKTTSTGLIIGKIQFQPGWRCYVFEPVFPTIWSSNCLLDIIVKLNELNDERKE